MKKLQMLEMIQAAIPAEFNELGEMIKEATAEVSNLLHEENICLEVIPKEKKRNNHLANRNG